MKKYFMLIGALLLIGISVSVVLWRKVHDMEIHFRKVNVIVQDVIVIEPANLKEQRQYTIKVRYQGEVKELQNVTKGFAYIKGQVVEVLEANDRFYEDESGVRTDTNMAMYYFISLGFNFVLMVLFITVAVSYNRRRAV